MNLIYTALAFLLLILQVVVGNPVSAENGVVSFVAPGSSAVLLSRSSPMSKSPPPLCNIFQGADVGRFREGAAYLRKKAEKGQTCNSDIRFCNQISCSYGASVQLCNDNFFPIETDCGYLATYIDDIINSCQRKCGQAMCVNGQFFDHNGYNLILRHENDCNGSHPV